MSIVLKNNAKSTLSAAISSLDTTIPITDTSSFPSLGADEYFYLTIESTAGAYEIVKVTQTNNSSFVAVRGQENTIAIPFSAGARVELRVTVQSMEDFLLLATNVLDEAYGPSWNGDTQDAPSRNALYDKIETLLESADIGVTVQGYDADTAKLDVAQDWSEPQTFNYGVHIGEPDVSTPAQLVFERNDLHRWSFFRNITAESGADAGSNFDLYSHDDAGSVKNLIFRVTRSTGVLNFSIQPTISGSNILKATDIGTSVQAYDADLTTWAGLTPSANAQSLVTAANYAAMRGLLGLEPGTDFNAYDAGLEYLSGLNFTNEATFKAGVNLEIGVDVQAYDADLTTWAGLTPSANAQSLVTAANYAAMRTLLDLEPGVDFVGIGGGTYSGDISVPDEVYGVGWNGSLEVPTKNALYDKIETLSSGSLTDGDKGDITVSASGATWTIDNDVVTFAKLQNVTANSVVARAAGTDGDASAVTLAASQLLGRGSTGDVAAITLGSGLSMTGTTLAATGGGVSDGDKGDITVSASGATWTIDNTAVTYAKMQNVAGLSVMGRSTNSSGVAADITGTDGQVLRVSGTALGFGTIATAGIADAAVTLAKMANIAQDTIIGRTAAGAGVPIALSSLPWAYTGDVTRPADSNAQTIANNAVSNAKFRQGVARSVVGVTGNATANVADIQGTANQFLQVNSGGTALAFTTLSGDATLSSGVITIANNAVTLAKMATMATDSILGRATAATGNVEVLAALPFAYTGDVTRAADSNVTAIDRTAITGKTADTTPDHATDYVLTDDASASALKKVLLQYIGAGKQAFWVPAAAIAPRSNTPCATLATFETATNRINYDHLSFDATTQEFAVFDWKAPKAIDTNTFTFIFVWSHPSTTVNFGVVWGISGAGRGDADAMEIALGTAQIIADTGGTTDTLYLTAATPAVTIGGTFAAEDVLKFQISRNPADASDTLAVDARLHGVYVIVNTNRNNET
jgi:hypothetical protein